MCVWMRVMPIPVGVLVCWESLHGNSAFEIGDVVPDSPLSKAGVKVTVKANSYVGQTMPGCGVVKE